MWLYHMKTQSDKVTGELKKEGFGVLTKVDVKDTSEKQDRC